MLYTVDQLSGRRIREGELLAVSVVRGANILRDIREMITNTLGGRMKRYEYVTNQSLDEAFERLTEKAKSKGYDGVVAVRIAHPHIVDGCVAIVIYGTGFNFMNE